MTDHESEGSVRVEVWMRDLSPPPDDPRRTVLARLRGFESEGTVDDVSVRVWGESIEASNETSDESSSPVRERIDEFREWADNNGHSLEPAFRRQERSSMVSDERTTVIRLPLQCLAIYEDDRLVGVFPCTTDDGTSTVTDCLNRLGTGDLIEGSNPA